MFMVLSVIMNSSENDILFKTKIAKIHSLFLTTWLENHTLWSRPYLYSIKLCKGVPHGVYPLVISSDLLVVVVFRRLQRTFKPEFRFPKQLYKVR